MNNQAESGRDYVGIFILLLLAVFTTELAIMERFCTLFVQLGPVASGILDAGTLVLLSAAPLWFLFYRLFPVDPEADRWNATPWTLLRDALAWVFLSELVVTLVLSLIGKPDCLTDSLADASLCSLLCAFPLWRVLSRPEVRKRSVAIMKTPLRFYVLLLFSVFISDLLHELVFPMVPPTSLKPDYFVDAFLTTRLGAPLLWLLVTRPMKRASRSERARVAAIYNQVVDAILVIGPQGRISSFNPAAEKLFGFAAQDIVGQSAALLLEGGDLALNDLMRKANGDPAAPLFREFKCRRRNGLPLVMTISLSVIQQEETTEFLLIMRDITKRKSMQEALRESEARFRQIFQQSEDAILFMKPGGCEVLDANAKAERVFGYSLAELQHGGFVRICAAADPPVLAENIAGIEQGREVRQEFACRRKDGAEIIVSFRGKAMSLQEGAITYCSFRDITDRVRMEDRTREIQAKLIHTNKMVSLGLMVSGVAHEINNPNNFIMANCELLSKISADTVKALNEYGPGPGEQIYLGGVPLLELGDNTKRLIDGIATGSRRVNDIVTTLKGFARQEQNKQRCDVDVSQVARAATSLMHHELIKFTDNFHLELTDNLPPVCGHGQQLGQVLINLLMNACQALPGREKGIWLATGFDAASGLVSITVRDEGNGISKDDTQRVLEPFFTTKLDRGGTGLGLSISETIVKEHGGTLEFSSEPGQGTTFVVRIPAAKTLAKEQA